jgi:hypothetical protein
MFSALTDQYNAWRNLDAVCDAARDTEEKYAALERKYLRLQAAARNVTAQRRIPSGWFGLMNTLRNLDQVLYEIDKWPDSAN